MGKIDHRAELREFLSSRRARITPEQAGLPAYGGNRRVSGLRREEVAMLAGVSIDYYVRMERGNLSGASDSALNALATALQLDEAERDHLFALARAAEAGRGRQHRTRSISVRPAVQQVLDAITDAPAWVRNGRHDILAVNLDCACAVREVPALPGTTRTPNPVVCVLSWLERNSVRGKVPKDDMDARRAEPDRWCPGAEGLV